MEDWAKDWQAFPDPPDQPAGEPVPLQHTADEPAAAPGQQEEQQQRLDDGHTSASDAEPRQVPDRFDRMKGELFARLDKSEEANRERWQRLDRSIEKLQSSIDDVRRDVVVAGNFDRRTQNLTTNDPNASRGTLLPLMRERPAPAAGAPALGALPPVGVFPADCDKSYQLTDLELDALEEFYGERFSGSHVGARVAAFIRYITRRV